MKKKLLSALLILMLFVLSLFPALAQQSTYTKYSKGFFGTFDTWVSLIGYATKSETFEKAFSMAEQRFIQLHKLYDKYNPYEGINNIYTLNKQAAQGPVRVEEDLLNLLIYTKNLQALYPNTLNIAMGAVLDIWHSYREEALATPSRAALPPRSLLEEAAGHTSMDDVTIDEKNSTIYFEDPLLQLDVGAIAKGYATQLVANEMVAYGMPSFIISAGGNVASGDPPQDGRAGWSVGVQDPSGFVLDPLATIASIQVSHMAVVTSGDYQRYYEVDGKKYHHIIDPSTLLPADHVKQVTVITPDSGMADFLSTVLFVLPTQQALEIVETLEDTQACWITMDDQVITSSGWEAFLNN